MASRIEEAARELVAGKITIEGLRKVIEDKDSEIGEDEADVYRSIAKSEWEAEGECEFDEDATVSLAGDGSGAYVQAWVWVDNPEGEEDADTDDDDDDDRLLEDEW